MEWQLSGGGWGDRGLGWVGCGQGHRKVKKVRRLPWLFRPAAQWPLGQTLVFAWLLTCFYFSILG